jgi:hypothetical protein
MIRWVDRNHWSVSAFFFMASVLTFTVWSMRAGKPILLAGATAATRQQVYSSLTGTSSSLLGFTVAAVAILAAFGPRATRTEATEQTEARFAKARSRIIVSLLITSAFLLVLLVSASLALATDSKPNGNSLINVLLLSSATGGTFGLLVSGLGLSLAVIERSRH